jgi:threonine dehydratase
VREIIQTTHTIAEGAGALAYAALKKEARRFQGQRVACVLSGGNASMALLSRALAAKRE